MKKIIYFYNGRSAMSYGIDLLKMKKNSIILLPEIICDVAVKVFLKKKLKVKFYKLDNYFEPIWSDINRYNFKNISAILMIHFFGYPQKYSKFLNLAKKKGIYLIEDNCHSFPIQYKKRTLGKIGHIGIDSPRKLIDELYSGGRLYINFDLKTPPMKIQNFHVTKKQIFKNKIKEKFKKFYKLYKFNGNRPKFEYPYLYSDLDNDFSIKLIDKKSFEKIKNINLHNEYDKRKIVYSKIDKFIRKNNMKCIFKLKKNLIPMYYVAQTKNFEHSKKIFNWAWSNKVQALSWPSFYKKFKLNKNLYKRWQRYICFPLNQEISIINEKKI